MSKSLERRAKEVIMQQMHDLGAEISRDQVVELIRPHYMFDFEAAKESALKKRANSLMAQFKDENGIRSYFNYKNGAGDSMYVDVENTKDVKALDEVKDQLNAKFAGLNESKNKVIRRQQELLGQTSMFKIKTLEQ